MNSLPSQTSIVIIGCGFSGLGMAIQLKKNGFNDFILLEKVDSVGGVWRDNIYPGCGCDVQSHLYSFSFAPNPNWSEKFSNQREIHEYLKKVAVEHGLDPHIHYRSEFLSSNWSDQDQWQIEIRNREGVQKVRSQFLISAVGAFNEALIPDVRGLENFKGPVFHSSKWNHEYDLTGKKVAVLGTGASAIQFVPAIQPLVKELHLFQRTPAWVVPRPNRPITGFEKWIFSKFKWTQTLNRKIIYVIREAVGFFFRHPRYMKLLQLVALNFIRRSVKDPVLRKKLTPNYNMGCKRVLISNTYYPALTKSNVSVITDAVTQISAQSVHFADTETAVDAIILGTGFRVTDFSFTKDISKTEGHQITTLHDIWQSSPRAYLGITTSDFKNLFFLLGPNTGLGHNSVVLMIEAQIGHLMSILNYMKKNSLTAIQAKPEKLKTYNAELDQKSTSTIWLTGGCKSWYLDPTGRNSTLWPMSVGQFRTRLSKFSPSDYKFT